MVEARPGTNLPLTLSDKVLEVFCWSGLIFIWLWAFLSYNKLPEVIPIHYNLAGEADGFASKKTLWFSPVLATFFVCFFWLMARYSPALIRSLEELPPIQFARKLRTGNRILRFARILMVALFGGILIHTVRVADTYKMVDINVDWKASALITILSLLSAIFLPAVLLLFLKRTPEK